MSSVLHKETMSQKGKKKLKNLKRETESEWYSFCHRALCASVCQNVASICLVGCDTVHRDMNDCQE
jgi:hypothetical protein